ncbi:MULTISPECIES: IclR family transcriptional regulator C-terminal domain-containing protein [unclassified Beijerinckia]|uniref:IclR family transcriptional regulator n=1 Tax=unclassified Beijerinckia TaxID=2638183 RepID=UPI000898844D|nr:MULTISPECIES: IclR family transcriptional regulator C-terminal domain-containing protein [unclassified Beijerinckia]MDH7795013.1 DNA-binding IclR family transcriptional regulator [Beijerinckia sp. GAS462]SEB84086.1 transcriptional regulator, IclR family [Beijerinckia sp. 28-YEA-48]
MGKHPDDTAALSELLTGQTDRYLVPGLVRGLAVLLAFSPERPQLSLRELADALGVTRSAVFRIAYTLTELGFLTHQPETRSYMLGPSVLRLGYGYLASRDLVQVALPHLEALRDRTGWSAHLGVLEGKDVVYLLRVPTRQGLASIVHVGSRLPAYATTMGRILLAHLSEDEVIALYRDTPLSGAGPRAVSDLPALLAQLRQDRARGFVVHIGGFQAGVASAAAALRDVSGNVVAAINISAASTLTDQGEIDQEIVPQLLSSADLLSQALGYAAPATG